MNTKNKQTIRKIVILSNLIAAAIVLSIIESQITIIKVPGAKLGLANLITLVVLYLYGFKEASVVVLIRIPLVAVLSGSTLETFLMGLTGGVAALIAMGLFKNIKIGIILVSLIGSITHQIGQILMGILLLGASEIIIYLGIMIPLGIITGIVNGFIAEKFILNLRQKQHQDD